MTRAIVCILLGASCSAGLAEDAKSVLEFLLDKTELAVVVQLVDEPIGRMSEAGVVNYNCKVKVLEVLKGPASKDENLSVNVVRFEMAAEGRLPWLKKGAKCILFLKSVRPNHPPWEIVDVWFGVQRYGPWMARALKRMGRPETAENPREAAVVFADRFQAALAAADTKAMQELYAPQVVLRRGSELLNQQWGITGAGDRDRDVPVDREKLIAGYRKLIEKVGTDNWAAIFSKIREKDVYRTFATTDDSDWAARKGDLTVRISIGPGDDALRFVFRREPDGHWRVVAEATDY